MEIIPAMYKHNLSVCKTYKWLTWVDTGECCTVQLWVQDAEKRYRVARQLLHPSPDLNKPAATFCILK